MLHVKLSGNGVHSHRWDQLKPNTWAEGATNMKLILWVTFQGKPSRAQWGSPHSFHGIERRLKKKLIKLVWKHFHQEYMQHETCSLDRSKILSVTLTHTWSAQTTNKSLSWWFAVKWYQLWTSSTYYHRTFYCKITSFETQNLKTYENAQLWQARFLLIQRLILLFL